MRLAVHRFEPSCLRGEHQMLLPAGAHVLSARVSVTLGDGELVLAVPDQAVGTEPVTFLFLWEDPPTAFEGDASAWRHVGSWSYRAGSWQHCLVKDPSRKARGGGLNRGGTGAVSAGVATDSSRSEATG